MPIAMVDALQFRFGVALLASTLCAGVAHAEDEDMRLMAEPTAYTDVLDAFEELDPFDLSFTIGFQRTWENLTVQRETVTMSTVDGRTGENAVDVAHSSVTTNALAFQLKFGLYRDLMLSVGIPLVLTQVRSLGLPDEAACDGCLMQQQDTLTTLSAPSSGAPAEQQLLFDPTNEINAKSRSGVPAVHVGAAWGVTNQNRTPHLPTWRLGLESEIGTGDVMVACLAGDEGCDGGISRGTVVLRFSSRWSYRWRLLEPYVGLSHAAEWATSGTSQILPDSAAEGSVDGGMPSETTGTVGVAIVGWEDRARYQRLALDTRVWATHVSSGRDYSPLFDVLGSSQNPYLTAPNYDRLLPVVQGPEEVPFTGVTNIDASAKFGLRTAVVLQAARYVRFRFGFGAELRTPHLISGSDACNGEVKVDVRDPRVGNCKTVGNATEGLSNGIYNPVHRPVIDLPGGRFLADTALTYDIFIQATGQF